MSSKNDFQFCSDKEITSIKEDKLDRKTYSEYLKDAILSSNKFDRLVIGLSGEWGSGKTSIINMSIEYLEKKSQYKAIQKMPLVIKFDPWNFTDQSNAD